MSARNRRRVPIVCAGVLLAALGLGSVAPSQSQAADGTLTVTKGTVRATKLAGNLTGREAVLKGNSSTASQKVSGTGPLVLMARGISCKGNKFGPNRAVSSCPFTAYPAVTLTQSNNTFEMTGAPVNPLVVVS